jgi:hypothetical protein
VFKQKSKSLKKDSKMKKNFLFVVCEAKTEKMVQETLTKNKVQTKSNRTIGDINVFYVKGNENAITSLGIQLIALKNSLPMEILLFDEEGVI